MKKNAIAVALATGLIGMGLAPFPAALATAADSVGNLLAVSNCLDDSSSGSLRSVLMGANDGDVIDLSGLSCSVITLTQGELTPPHSVSIVGPRVALGQRPRITIDGNYNGRVFNSAPVNTLSVSNVVIANGIVDVPDGAARGGCIMSGNLHLDHVEVMDCRVTGQYALGGGIFVKAGTITMSRSIVTGNRAAGRTSPSASSYVEAAGGGIYSYVIPFVDSTVTIADSTISDNEATIAVNGNGGQETTFGGGLGAFFRGYQHTYISGSTFSGNRADRQSGAIEAWGYVTIANSTLSGNEARYCGAMCAINAYRLDVENSTIAFNSAFRNGGVFAPFSSTLIVNSSIIANNYSTEPTAAADLAAALPLVASGAHNLITTMNEIQFDMAPLRSDPRLLPLMNNGGFTKTHALAADSPAIATGDNRLNLPADQRGMPFPRAIGGLTDIGSFERGDGIFSDSFD
jgi:hypothetical protein